jgi:hypothetical protein
MMRRTYSVSREKDIAKIKELFKNIDSRDGLYPNYVYDRIYDMSQDHDLVANKVNFEILSFNTKNGSKSYTPMLTIAAHRSISQAAGWAGCDPIVWAEETVTVNGVQFPEWGQITMYKMVEGVRCAFTSPKLYAKETARTTTMWKATGRPRFMFEKNIEAAGHRRMCPEKYQSEETYYAAEEGYNPEAPEIDVDNKGLNKLNNVKANEEKKSEPKTKTANKGDVPKAKATEQGNPPPNQPGKGTPAKQPAQKKAEPVQQEEPQEDPYADTKASSGGGNTKTSKTVSPPKGQTQAANTQTNAGGHQESSEDKPVLSPDDVDMWISCFGDCKTLKEVKETVESLKAFELTADQRKALGAAKKEAKTRIGE